MSKVYTIGHSAHKINYFLSILRTYNINCIIDVRSIPYSKYTPQFNEDNLKTILHNNKIHYISMGKELGARRDETDLYTLEGYLDFEKVRMSSLFIKGIERIKAGIEKGFNITLMCTEKDPIDCHRNILVARELYKQDYDVVNILDYEKIEIQSDLEKRLLDMYFPNRTQPALFCTGEWKCDKELINEAYVLRNKDIGYSIFKEKEGSTDESLYHRIYQENS